MKIIISESQHDRLFDNQKTQIKSFGNLTSVGGNLFLRKTPISKIYSKDQIRKMVTVGGDIYL